MWQMLVNQFMSDPWWFGGSAIIIVVVLVLFLFSLIRNARSLIWFYTAAILVAGLYSAFVFWFPVFLEALVSYRSDWSLVFMLNNVSYMTVLSQLVLYFVIYSFLAVVMIVVLELFALLTFRWQRLKMILERSLSESWLVVLFTLLTLALNFLLLLFVEQINFQIINNFFFLFAFIFCLQLFLRLVDNAYLHTPKLFLEFTYATGLVFLLLRFGADWLAFSGQAQAFAKTMFFSHLFVFFLVVLLLGYLATFFVRALFSSAFFLEHYHQKVSLLLVWTSRLFLSERERAYAGHRILLGVLLSVIIGFAFVLMVLRVWLLALIPAFFLGYFILFILLDRQDDMRVRGDLVDERIETAVREVFFS